MTSNGHGPDDAQQVPYLVTDPDTIAGDGIGNSEPHYVKLSDRLTVTMALWNVPTLMALGIIRNPLMDEVNDQRASEIGEDPKVTESKRRQRDQERAKAVMEYQDSVLSNLIMEPAWCALAEMR